MIQLYLCTCFWQRLQNDEFNNVMSLISTVCTVITVIMTFIIFRITDSLQKKQAASQSWESLITEYRKSNFGIAVKAVIDFYIEDCGRCLSKIRDKYIERYRTDFSEKSEEGETITDKKNTLHFYRRLLEQYYWQLWLCINSEGFDSDLVSQYFNQNEMSIIVIVYYMGKAASVPEVYKSILPYTKKRTIGDDIRIAKALWNLYTYFYGIFKPAEEDILHFM